MLIQLYQHDETGKTSWHTEGSPLPGKGWGKIPGKAKYMKKKAEESMTNKYLEKIAEKQTSYTKSALKGTAIGAGIGGVGGYAAGAGVVIPFALLAAALHKNQESGSKAVNKFMHMAGKEVGKRGLIVGGSAGMVAGLASAAYKNRGKEKRNE